MRTRRIRNRVGRYREARGLRQSDLAEIVGTSQKHVSRIESGLHAPTVTMALRFSRVLGVSVEQLWGEVGERRDVVMVLCDE